MSCKKIKDINNVTQRRVKPSTSSVQSSPTTLDSLDPGMTQLIRNEIRLAIREAITEEIERIKKELSCFEESIMYMNAQFDILQNTVFECKNETKKIKIENENLQATVKDLESKVLLLEQESYQSNIEIQCLPEYKQENLASTIQQIGKVISFPITEKDIQSCFRVRKQDQKSKKPKAVICKLSNRLQRDNFLAAVLRYNKSHSNEKLNTKLLGFGDSGSPIYISEHLTKTNRDLHAATRIKAKEKQYKYVWIRSGKIFIRKDDNSPARLITHKECLNSII